MDKQKEKITELTLDQMDKITGGAGGRYMNDESDGPFAYPDGTPHSKRKHGLLNKNQDPWQTDLQKERKSHGQAE